MVNQCERTRRRQSIEPENCRARGKLLLRNLDAAAPKELFLLVILLGVAPPLGRRGAIGGMKMRATFNDASTRRIP